MRHPLLRAIGVLLALVLVAYLAAVGYLYLFQRSYVFEPGGSLTSPEEEGLEETEIVTFRAADGTELTGWYHEADLGLPTVLYFHGNAGSVSERAPRFQQIAASGFGFLAFSYRGYPGSGGHPTEVALFSDALEIFDWLAARTEAVVVHGESLGTAVATYVAAERPAKALILEAPFTAAVDIAAATYPWVPVSYLMRDPFLSRENITRVEEPVLIAHGTGDVVVPVEYGRQLFEFAHEPKRLVIFEGAGHSDLWKTGLWEIVREFLAANGVTAHAWVRRIPSLAG